MMLATGIRTGGGGGGGGGGEGGKRPTFWTSYIVLRNFWHCSSFEFFPHPHFSDFRSNSECAGYILYRHYMHKDAHTHTHVRAEFYPLSNRSSGIIPPTP